MNNVVSITNSVVRNQAVFDLGRSARQQAKSVTRLASGSRMADTSEDPGAYAVSLKLKLTANALDGVEKGLLHAQSFLQAQEDGLGLTRCCSLYSRGLRKTQRSTVGCEALWIRRGRVASTRRPPADGFRM